MIKNLLLVVSLMMLFISYIRIILIYLKTKNKRIANITGFDLAKEIASNYEEINVVESKEIAISKYNLKRNIIKLTSKNYEENDIFTLTISDCLSGYSLANINQNKYLKLLSKITSNIDYLPKSSILTLIISILTTNIGDAKIGIILLGVILIYQYILIQINTESYQYSKESLKKLISNEELAKVEKVYLSLLSLHTISFITTLILILREVLMIINI